MGSYSWEETTKPGAFPALRALRLACHELTVNDPYVYAGPPAAALVGPLPRLET